MKYRKLGIPKLQGGIIPGVSKKYSRLTNLKKIRCETCHKIFCLFSLVNDPNISKNENAFVLVT